MNVAPVKLIIEKCTGGGKKIGQLHVIPVCLRNDVVTGDDGNVFPEFSNTAEHEWLKLNHFSQAE